MGCQTDVTVEDVECQTELTMDRMCVIFSELQKLRQAASPLQDKLQSSKRETKTLTLSEERFKSDQGKLKFYTGNDSNISIDLFALLTLNSTSRSSGIERFRSTV